jgi:hypothetical protein
MKVHPQLAGFILFCIERRGREWPALYDEMCSVARRHLYQGLQYDELRELGLSLGLNDLGQTTSIVDEVIDQFCNESTNDELKL